jgi:hypothetical protein
MLENRRLPKRLFAISYAFLVAKVNPSPAGAAGAGETPLLPEAEQQAYEAMRSSFARPDDRAAFAKDVRIIAKDLRRTVFGQPLRKSRVWIDYPPTLELLTLDLQVRTPDGQIMEGGVFRQQAAAFPLYPSSGSYIYFSGDDDAMPLLFVVFEKHLYERFRVWFGSDAAHYAKQSWSDIEVTKRRIEEKIPDWFSVCRRLRPSSSTAAAASNQPRLQTLAERFREYSGPNGKVDLTRIRSYLDQFPEALVDPMITVLENLIFLNREQLGIGFSNKLVEEGLAGNSLVPLSSGLQKSAAMLPYMMSDSGATGLTFKTLEEALNGDQDITFYEDYICSGRQPRATVQTWFGRPAELKDQNISVKLSESNQTLLRRRRLHFRFVFGTTWGMKNLRELIEELSLQGDVNATIVREKEKSPIYDFLDADIAASLEAFLRDVGTQLLLTTWHDDDPTKWTTELCEQRCFGYRNHGLITVSSLNCPTSTITALWKSGRFQDVSWMPLFPRRHQPIVSVSSTEKQETAKQAT